MSDYGGSSSRGSRGSYQGGNRYDNTRTVQYGNSRGRGGNFKSRNRVKRNVGSFRPKGERYNDGDVDMGDGDGGPSTSRNRHTPYDSRGRGGRGGMRRPYRGGGSSRRGGSSASLRMAAMDERDQSVMQRMGLPIGSRSGGSGGVPYSKSGWYKVLIPYGSDMGKQFVVDNLTQTTTVPFKPHKFTQQNKHFYFYVDSPAAAKALKYCSRKVTGPNGKKMMVSVQACNDPGIGMTDENVMKLKVAMSNRYDPATKKLDLSNMYNNEELRKEGIYLQIGRTEIGFEVLKVIGEHIPELTSLDISKNKLYNLNSFAKIADKARNIKAINLGENEIKYERDLERLSGLKHLTEVRLEGNPLCDKLDDKQSYISAIRKILPKIICLDGHTLPPPITFEVESTASKLPPKQGNKFPNEQVQNLVCHFLKQYYDIFDGGNRQGLLAAYHDNAVFSLSAYYNPMFNKQPGFNYLYDSRNIIKVTGASKADKMRKVLKVGKANVVAAIQEFPKTQHDPASFVVDVAMANANLMQFVVTGIFRETSGSSHNSADPIRSFSRTFITVPVGEGIVIVNEQFSITNATEEQTRNAFRTEAPTPTPSPSTANVPAPAAVGGDGLTQVQQQMLTEFIKNSTMNAEFSLKCLSECAWDFDRAAQAFTMAKEKGQIPPEAFVK